MATIKMALHSLLSIVRGANDADAKFAEDFALKAYKKTGGPTPELQRVYGRLLENRRANLGKKG
jgi:hypothetical protein